MTKCPIKTKEQEAFEMIEQGVVDVYTSDNFKNYLQFVSKFHNYSFNNTILILSQFPSASLIAGYTSWNRDFKRQVNKGEKAIKILAPYDAYIKRTVDKLDSDGNVILDEYGRRLTEEVQTKILKFRVVNVFDISQTSGEPIPELISDLKGTSQEVELLIESIKEVSDIPIEFVSPENDETLYDGAKGYYSRTDDKIVINSELEDLQIAKTLAHEYAHSLLHKDKSIKKSQSQREIEAESLAFVICNHFGIDTSDYSFTYIASYSQMDQEFLKQTLLDIKKDATTIIEKIEPIFERRKTELIKDLIYYTPVDMEKMSIDLVNDLTKDISETPIYNYLRSKDADEVFGREELKIELASLIKNYSDEYPIQCELYNENEFYKEALEESIFLRCYYDIINPHQDRPFIESSIERENYLTLESIAKPILNEDAYYMKYSTPHFMDLNIEVIGENRIAMSHYYELNGDMMADPDVEIVVDNINKLLFPMTYQQDGIQVFYDTSTRPDMTSSLNDFVKEWLANIKVNQYKVNEIKTDEFNLEQGKDDEAIIKFCKDHNIESMAIKIKDKSRCER